MGVGYMEKYWETKRELESLQQRLSTEKDDKMEALTTAKRSLEKKVCVCTCVCVDVTLSLPPTLAFLPPAGRL